MNWSNASNAATQNKFAHLNEHMRVHWVFVYSYALHEYCTGFLVKSYNFQHFGCRLPHILTTRPQKHKSIESDNLYFIQIGSFISCHIIKIDEKKKSHPADS